MVSVRCMRPGLPGGNSMTANRVPFSGGGVPMMRAPRSSMSSPIEQSAGAESVDQISVEAAPEAPLFALVAGPSMMTLATLLRSWPVTTRRIGGSLGASLIFFPIMLIGIGATGARLCHDGARGEGRGDGCPVVMRGLVPRISLRLAWQCLLYRDGRDKPGHDKRGRTKPIGKRCGI